MKLFIFGGKSSKSGKLGSAEPSSVQIKKMSVKFSHKHVQRQTGTSFTVPQPFGTAHDRPRHIRRSQNQHSNTDASVVVCPVWSSDSHDQAVCGASSHLPLLLPLLLDKPTRTPRCRVGCRPSTALFFLRWGRPNGCRCQFILLFFPLAICSFVLSCLFLLLLLLLLTLLLPCLLLLPRLALRLPMIFLPLLFGVSPLRLGSLRIRHLLDF